MRTINSYLICGMTALWTLAAPATSAQPLSAESPNNESPKVEKSTASLPAIVNSGAESEVKTLLGRLQQSIAEADPAKTAELWADNAQFIDQNGDITSGPSALQARFERVMGVQGRQSLTMRPATIQLPSANVALVDGVVMRDSDGAKLSTSRFSMVLTKTDGRWQIARATETVIAGSSAHEQLEQLAWLLGKWSTGDQATQATVDFEWSANRNFIQSKAVVTKPNSATETTTQVLGWDPRAGKLVSWNFDPQGGFSYGTWTRDGNKWVVNLAGITSGGNDSKSTDIYTNQDANQFVWQSTNRFIDGSPVPDTQPVSVKRLVSQP